MKTVHSLLSLALVTVVLSGCTYFSRDHIARQPSQEDICARLRQQLIFQTNTLSSNQLQAPPTQNASTMKDYYHYHCDVLEPNTESLK